MTELHTHTRSAAEAMALGFAGRLEVVPLPSSRRAFAPAVRYCAVIALITGISLILAAPFAYGSDTAPAGSFKGEIAALGLFVALGLLSLAVTLGGTKRIRPDAHDEAHGDWPHDRRQP